MGHLLSEAVFVLVLGFEYCHQALALSTVLRILFPQVGQFVAQGTTYRFE